MVARRRGGSRSRAKAGVGSMKGNGRKPIVGPVAGQGAGIRAGVLERQHRVRALEESGERCLVFLYGTMKRGFFNYNAYLSCAVQRGQARYVGDARTSERDQTLQMWGERRVPGLLGRRATSPENGRRVHGEIFEIDHKTLAALDDFFEDGPMFYQRRLISVQYEREDATHSAAPDDTTMRTAANDFHTNDPHLVGKRRAKSKPSRSKRARSRRRKHRTSQRAGLLPQGYAPVSNAPYSESRPTCLAYCWVLEDAAGTAPTSPVLVEYTKHDEMHYSNPRFQPKVLELMTGVDAGHFAPPSPSPELWRE